MESSLNEVDAGLLARLDSAEERDLALEELATSASRVPVCTPPRATTSAPDSPSPGPSRAGPSSSTGPRPCVPVQTPRSRVCPAGLLLDPLGRQQLREPGDRGTWEQNEGSGRGSWELGQRVQSPNHRCRGHSRLTGGLQCSLRSMRRVDTRSCGRGGYHLRGERAVVPGVADRRRGNHSQHRRWASGQFEDRRPGANARMDAGPHQ